MVGVAGFEPTASSSRTKRATKLRHTPVGASLTLVHQTVNTENAVAIRRHKTAVTGRQLVPVESLQVGRIAGRGHRGTSPTLQKR